LASLLGGSSKRQEVASRKPTHSQIRLVVATKGKSTKTATKKTSTKLPGPPARKQPHAMRPLVPPGYRFPTSPKGLLDWSWARERLTSSHNYVIVTVRPDGRPHAMGMHGLWHDDAYYFGSDPATRKAKNLAANPHCIVINERLDELVIVEGVVEKVDYSQLPKGLSDASKSKYGWPLPSRADGWVYKLVPRVVFAFPLKQIATAVTKWVFE
jgi:pyridoxamine 5'-phosphate oxidase-like protein